MGGLRPCRPGGRFGLGTQFRLPFYEEASRVDEGEQFQPRNQRGDCGSDGDSRVSTRLPCHSFLLCLASHAVPFCVGTLHLPDSLFIAAKTKTRPR